MMVKGLALEPSMMVKGLPLEPSMIVKGLSREDKYDGGVIGTMEPSMMVE